MPLFTSAEIHFPDDATLHDDPERGVLSATEQTAVIMEAEALVCEEMRLGDLVANPAAPSPVEQGLAAVTVTDYAFSAMADSPLLILPVGPVTSLTALSIDGAVLDHSALIVSPWTVRYRDGSCFSSGSDVLITATIGWATPADVPERIRSAVQLLVMDITTIHNTTAQVVSQELDGDTESFFDPRRARVHKFISRLVSPWSRPQIF